MASKKKKPNVDDYFGEDLALQDEMRGYVSRLMPGAMKDNSARNEEVMNRGTAKQFEGARANWAESAAGRGITRSSFDASAQGQLAGAESEAMADNFGKAGEMARGEQSDRLGFITQLLSSSNSLGRGKELAYGQAMDEYNQSEESRIGLMGKFGGIAGGTLAAGLGGMDWKQALASGLSPEYMEYLLGKKSGTPGAGSTMSAGSMGRRFGGLTKR